MIIVIIIYHCYIGDEPTSGLDSASAFKIVEYLNILARDGMTVLCTIHQPSSECFHLFDKLMLLVGGKTVYFGGVVSAVDYFASAGHPAPLFVELMCPCDVRSR